VAAVILVIIYNIAVVIDGNFLNYHCIIAIVIAIIFTLNSIRNTGIENVTILPTTNDVTIIKEMVRYILIIKFSYFILGHSISRVSKTKI